MDDVVQRLRAGLEAGAIDLADIMDAADEIERRRVTETEREAIMWSCVLAEEACNTPRAATLRGLLGRLT